jgi:hypothetical protein
VRSQHPCGNCWAQAWVSAHEARVKIFNDIPDEDIALSVGFVVACIGRSFGYDCGGGRLDLGDKIMEEGGVPDEECHPHKPHNPYHVNCNSRCSDWQENAAQFNIINWGELPDNASNLRELIKKELMRGPMACAVSMKEDFFYYKGGVYTPIMGDRIFEDGNPYHKDGSLKLNHGVCIMGWDDSRECWIMKNSWGTWHGDGGYDYFRYGGEGGGYGPSWNTWMDPIVRYTITLEKVEFIEPNNDIWDPGEQVNIIVTLKAKGMNFPNVQGILLTTHPDITINVGTYNFGTIIKDNSVDNSFSPYKATASTSASSPQNISFNLRVTSPDSNYSKDFQFEAQLGWVACAEISEFQVPSIHDSALAYGMAFDGTNLWVTDFYSDKIYKLNQNGDLIGEISAPEIKCTGIDYDTQNNWLWVHNSETKKIYKIDASTGNIITFFPSPADSYPTGLAFDGEYLWAVDRDKYKIYKVQTSGTLVSSFDIPQVQYGPRGLAYDPNGPSLILYMTHWESGLDSTVIYEISLDGRLTGKRCNTDGVRGNGRLVCVDPKKSQYWVNGGNNKGKICKIRGFNRVQGVEEDIVHPFISEFNILPNPSRGEVTIKFHVFKEKKVFVNIYDIAGKLVDCLAKNKLLESCEHKFKWHGVDIGGKKVGSGVYFCRIEMPNYTTTKKFVIVR